MQISGTFARFAGAALISATLIGTGALLLYNNVSDAPETPAQSENTLEKNSCQSFSAPVSRSDIDDRQEKISALKEKISVLKNTNGSQEAIDVLTTQKDALLMQNILEKLRINLMDYGGWEDFKQKLAGNGVELDNVCIHGYEVPMPVVLSVNESGQASMEINFIEISSEPTQDGHRLDNIKYKTLEEIDAALDTILTGRAIQNAALTGTSPNKSPVLNEKLAPESLAMILTLWQAQAAAEQILQAADTYNKTGGEDGSGLDAAAKDFPYLSEQIADIRLKAEIMSEANDNFSSEEREDFKRQVASAMLRMPYIRVQAYTALLGIVEEMASAEGGLASSFTHEPDTAELTAILKGIDETLAKMPVTQIYDRWQTIKDDPARDLIKKIEELKKSKPAQQEAPTAAPNRAAPSP